MSSATPTVAETTPAVCGACGADRPQVQYPVRDLLWVSPGDWRFVTCGACGHGYLDPRPSDAALGAFYSALYTPDNLQTMIRIGESGFDRGLQRRRVRDIRRAVEGPVRRLLDVGCGVGFFLRELGRAFPGAEALGVEVGGPAADHAESLGLTLHKTSFDQVALEPGSVDVLCMNHLVEHLPDPAAALARAAALVRPGGVIEVEVPRLDGWGRRWLGRWWWPHMPPQHIQIFSAEGLARALAGAGFSRVVSTRTAGYPLTASAALVLFARFTAGSESAHAGNWLVRGPATLLGLLALPLTVLFDALVAPLLNGPLGMGDILTVVARRDG